MGLHLLTALLRSAPAEYELSFSDEFDGSKLDAGKWIDQYPDHWGRFHGNNEQQYYAPDSHEIRDGKLILRAQKRALPVARGRPYTSAMIASQPHFVQTYGWWEMRAKFPAGKGLWPAFWLLPADKSWPPEIDVMEILGHDVRTLHMTFHRKPAAPGRMVSTSKSWAGPDFTRDFHTFALEWKAGELIWHVDGVERARYAGADVPAVPMYCIANLAVGGDWPGLPDASTPFPSTMEIDYVRVYRVKKRAQ